MCFVKSSVSLQLPFPHMHAAEPRCLLLVVPLRGVHTERAFMVTDSGRT